jgi:hypothetical protein
VQQLGDGGALRLRADHLAGGADHVPPVGRAGQVRQGRHLDRVGRRGAGAFEHRDAEIAGLLQDPAGDPLPEDRVAGELGGDRGTGQPRPPVRRELRHPPQRYRQLVRGQPGQRGGGQGNDALPDRFGQNGLRQEARIIRRRGRLVGYLR